MKEHVKDNLIKRTHIEFRSCINSLTDLQFLLEAQKSNLADRVSKGRLALTDIQEKYSEETV